MSVSGNIISNSMFQVTYDPARKRSSRATKVLGFFCSAVNSLMVTGGVNRDELFERFDRKLWSYKDRLTLFILATLPPVAALAAIYVGFRSVQGIRLALSL